MKSDEDANRALKLAYRYLAVRDRTFREVDNYLTRKGFSPADISEVLEKLNQAGYINDALFARKYIQEKKSRYGKRLIEKKLAGLGINKKLLEEELEVLDQQSQQDSAVRIARSRLKDYRNLSPDKAARRCFTMLSGRGYDRETVVRVSKEILEEIRKGNDCPVEE